MFRVARSHGLIAAAVLPLCLAATLAARAQNFADIKPSPQQVAWQELDFRNLPGEGHQIDGHADSTAWYENCTALDSENELPPCFRFLPHSRIASRAFLEPPAAMTLSTLSMPQLLHAKLVRSPPLLKQWQALSTQSNWKETTWPQGWRLPIPG